MIAAGIAVDMPAPRRPTVRVVVLSDAQQQPTIEANLDIPGDDKPLPEQLHDAAETVRSTLLGLSVNQVVIRRADWNSRAGSGDGPKIRLLMEGAVVSAARGVVTDTRLGTGKDIGGWYGSDKAGAEAAASVLLKANKLAAAYGPAAAAALAALA